MIRIAEHPELFPILRQEMIDVLGKEGLKKTAFYNLKIMDSVIKEAQRLKPVNICEYFPKVTYAHQEAIC